MKTKQFKQNILNHWELMGFCKLQGKKNQEESSTMSSVTFIVHESINS